jgi:hypothetical protein
VLCSIISLLAINSRCWYLFKVILSVPPLCPKIIHVAVEFSSLYIQHIRHVSFPTLLLPYSKDNASNFLFCISEVPLSNLGWNSDRLDWNFSSPFSHSSGKIWDTVLLFRSRPLPSTSFAIHCDYHSVTGRYITVFSTQGSAESWVSAERRLGFYEKLRNKS